MKTRHNRIPERATLLKEKKGVTSDLQIPCIIRLWSDYTSDGVPRMWFYCYKEDWRRSFVKAFTGKNYSDAEKYWTENVNLINTPRRTVSGREVKP